MKKLLTLFLALLMLFSLAACGEDDGGKKQPPEGYDEEYTIYVNDSDEWTPYEDGSGVKFENSKESVISITDDGKTVTFKGLEVGEAAITATYGGKTVKALVKVVKMTEKAVSVNYNPPDSYYYEYTVTDEDGKTSNYVCCKVGNVYATQENGDFYHSDKDSGLQYCFTAGSDGWISYEKEGYGDDQEAVDNAFKQAVIPLRQFFDCWEYSYRDASWDMKEYFVKYDNVANQKCAVFKISDAGLYTTGDALFWVELQTGCLMKYESDTTSRQIEVTKFEIGTSSIPETMKP